MKSMNFTVISGSTRQNSQSRKVADYIYKTFQKQTKPNLIQIIDLAVDAFPLWDEAIWSEGVDWHPCWSSISKKLNQTDAIIIVTPEWNGMAPPQLMNFFQLCSNQELLHKPALIVSVSSGVGGTYPVAELRMSSFKNTKICYIPEHVIVRDVENVLNHFDEAVDERDHSIRDRIKYSTELLSLYAEAFSVIRDSEIVKGSKYPYGM